MAALVLENVAKVYHGNVRAVDDLTLDVAEGELLVLVGPSGCGKTTTLRLIAGLEKPTRGSISIDAKPVDGLPPKDRDVAMVFQNYALYPHLTVAGNLAFGLKLRRIGRAEIARRVAEAADLLGLGELLGRRPGQLSGGQQQRAALGRAIVRQPKLFLFDEPLAHLDARLRDRMRHEIRRLHARLGVATLYVTHDQTEAMTLGQRIAVLGDGRVQQVADPMTLYNRPANRFVATLIGSPTMNFFSGRIERREDRLLFDGGTFSLPLADAWTTRLAPYTGKPITLGIRPEHIGSPAAERQQSPPRIPAVVEAVEPVGAESYVHLNDGTHAFLIRTETGRPFPLGGQTDPAVAIEKIHFFDPRTEQALR